VVIQQVNKALGLGQLSIRIIYIRSFDERQTFYFLNTISEKICFAELLSNFYPQIASYWV
jgi:hypothetical protein